MTPLNVVCNRNNSEIAQLFIQTGARVNVADRSGNLPLHYAARSGDGVVVKLLLENGKTSLPLIGFIVTYCNVVYNNYYYFRFIKHH